MDYIPRELEEELKKHIEAPEIIAVTGPRQAGKTTLINHLLKDLKNINKISFDDMKILEMFEHEIEDFIKTEIEGYNYVFIDEIQYADESGKRLKYIYDKYHTKIFISGSSATELSLKSMKYLVGRVFLFELFPLSFKEFLNYKEPELLKSEKPGKVLLERINKHLQEFLIYGGYPRAVIGNDKRTVLKNIYNTYLLKEIKEILNLTEDYKLSKLLEALAQQIGGIINYNELSNITEFSYHELKRYMNILDNTYICKEARNYHTNKRQELKKSPKIFFIDTGFRNMVLENFSEKRSDIGELHENFVASELLKNNQKLKYWRTKNKAEVDFVIDKERPIPIEVKTRNPKITRSFQSFIKKYNPEKGFILSQEERRKEVFENTEVIFLPITETHNIEEYTS